jgi:Tripartite tricarboxylate transporter TctB family
MPDRDEPQLGPDRHRAGWDLEPAETPRTESKPGRLADVGLAGLVLAAYVYALPRAGFVVATAAAVAVLAWRVGAPSTRAAAAGIATSLGLYILLHLVLGVALPEGVLGVFPHWMHLPHWPTEPRSP